MRKRLRRYSKPLAVVLLVALASGALWAQGFSGGLRAATVVPGAAVKLEPGKTAEVSVAIQIRPNYHINSNAPADEYLIPTRLTWESSGLDWKKTEYPEAETVNYSFSDKPLSVYSNKIVIVSHFAVPEKVPASLTELKGKLRYQACNNRACLPPKTADVTVRLSR